jgi:hypothetical protein
VQPVHPVKKVLTLSILAVLLPAVLAACGNDDGSGVRDAATGSASGASGSGSGSSGSASGSEAAGECEPVGDPESADVTVDVSLDEWTVKPAETDVAEGKVLFHTENIGEEPHELVVVAGADVPTADDGSVDEDQLPEGALLGEIEKYPPGETCDGVFELEPGTYTLFCNIVEEEEDGTIEAHVAKGMITTITVS